MLRIWRSRAIWAVVTALALTTLSAGSAWAVDFDAVPATDPVSGIVHHFEWDVTSTAAQNGSGTWTYTYEIRVNADYTPASGVKMEAPMLFKVQIGATTILGHTAVTPAGLSNPSSWDWQTAGDTYQQDGWAVWYLDSASNEYVNVPNNLIGTFTVEAAGAPGVVGLGMVQDSPMTAVGNLARPSTPELPSLFLLLTSGGPLLGIGYLRRRLRR
jgi:hypothetical protein